MERKWNVEFDHVGLVYPNGYEALKDVSFKIDQGEFVAIIGLSGAGKTTLLKTVNKLNKITSGSIYVGDKSPEVLNEYKEVKKKYKDFAKTYKAELQKVKGNRAKEEKLRKQYKSLRKAYLINKENKPYYSLRQIKGRAERKYKTNIGMVFQRYNLIYKASVLSNVMSAKLAQISPVRAMLGIFTREEKAEGFKALAQVNILETAYQRAENLSGGQMQRVALARTITQGAKIILADEPVGALDPIMAKAVMQSFLTINKKQNKTILINLHHVDLALQYADRIIGVKAGQVVFDGPSTSVTLKTLKNIYGDHLEGFDAHEFKEIQRKRKEIQKEFK